MVVCFKAPGMKFPAAVTEQKAQDQREAITDAPGRELSGATFSGAELASRGCRRRTW